MMQSVSSTTNTPYLGPPKSSINQQSFIDMMERCNPLLMQAAQQQNINKNADASRGGFVS